MRSSLSIFIIAAWVAVPVVRAQSAAAQPAATQPAATEPAATQAAATQRAATRPAAALQAAVQPTHAQPVVAARRGPGAAHPSRQSRSRRAATATAATAQRSAAARNSGGVLSLGATDITGNKELPKVMVIVPWKDSLGAGGVVRPTDSLLDEVLAPVDRGVFQRQVRYYEQLDGAGQRAPAGVAGRVAPGGDSH